jgi:Caudovirus prohead serine protease
LVVTSDAAGARYSVTVNPDDPMAMSTLAKVARGDVRGSSLVFRTLDPDVDEEWRSEPGQALPLRIVKRARVLEIGPVSLPVYNTTSASARSRAEQLQGGGPSVSADDDDRLRRLQLEQVRYRTDLSLMTDAAVIREFERQRAHGRSQPASNSHTRNLRAIERLTQTPRHREYLFRTGQIDRVVLPNAR